MPNKVTHVSIPIELVESTLNYLATKPFVEVFDLIEKLKSSADKSFAEQNSSVD